MEAHFSWLRSSSMTLGTRIAWVGLGDRDKLIEDVLDCSMNVNSYLTADLLLISGRNFFETGLETAEGDLVGRTNLGEKFQSFPWKLADSENDLGDGMLFKNAL